MDLLVEVKIFKFEYVFIYLMGNRNEEVLGFELIFRKWEYYLFIWDIKFYEWIWIVKEYYKGMYVY